MKQDNLKNHELQQDTWPSTDYDIVSPRNNQKDGYGVLYRKDGIRLIECGNKKLEQYRVKNGTKTICNHAFLGCTRLSKITIPKSVVVIGEYAFMNTGITKLPNLGSITSIAMGTFSSCTQLSSVSISDNIAKIEPSAFTSCTSLKRVVIGNGVTNIENNAFYGCVSLTNLVIGSSVKAIGEFAFSGCTSLKKLIIPNNVQEIGFKAFQECTALSELTIGNGITKIRNATFKNCAKIKTIYSKSVMPPNIQQTFSDVDKKKCVVYVPMGSINLYKENKGWAIFPDIREMDFE